MSSVNESESNDKNEIKKEDTLNKLGNMIWKRKHGNSNSENKPICTSSESFVEEFGSNESKTNVQPVQESEWNENERSRSNTDFPVQNKFESKTYRNENRYQTQNNPYSNKTKFPYSNQRNANQQTVYASNENQVRTTFNQNYPNKQRFTSTPSTNVTTDSVSPCDESSQNMTNISNTPYEHRGNIYHPSHHNSQNISPNYKQSSNTDSANNSSRNERVPNLPRNDTNEHRNEHMRNSTSNYNNVTKKDYTHNRLPNKNTYKNNSNARNEPAHKLSSDRNVSKTVYVRNFSTNNSNAYKGEHVREFSNNKNISKNEYVHNSLRDYNQSKPHLDNNYLNENSKIMDTTTQQTNLSSNRDVSKNIPMRNFSTNNSNAYKGEHVREFSNNKNFSKNEYVHNSLRDYNQSKPHLDNNYSNENSEIMDTTTQQTNLSSNRDVSKNIPMRNFSTNNYNTYKSEQVHGFPNSKNFSRNEYVYNSSRGYNQSKQHQDANYLNKNIEMIDSTTQKTSVQNLSSNSNISGNIHTQNFSSNNNNVYKKEQVHEFSNNKSFSKNKYVHNSSFCNYNQSTPHCDNNYLNKNTEIVDTSTQQTTVHNLSYNSDVSKNIHAPNFSSSNNNAYKEEHVREFSNNNNFSKNKYIHDSLCDYNQSKPHHNNDYSNKNIEMIDTITQKTSAQNLSFNSNISGNIHPHNFPSNNYNIYKGEHMLELSSNKNFSKIENACSLTHDNQLKPHPNNNYSNENAEIINITTLPPSVGCCDSKESMKQDLDKILNSMDEQRLLNLSCNRGIINEPQNKDKQDDIDKTLNELDTHRLNSLHKRGIPNVYSVVDEPVAMPNESILNCIDQESKTLVEDCNDNFSKIIYPHPDQYVGSLNQIYQPRFAPMPNRIISSELSDTDDNFCNNVGVPSLQLNKLSRVDQHKDHGVDQYFIRSINCDSQGPMQQDITAKPNTNDNLYNAYNTQIEICKKNIIPMNQSMNTTSFQNPNINVPASLPINNSLKLPNTCLNQNYNYESTLGNDLSNPELAYDNVSSKYTLHNAPTLKKQNWVKSTNAIPIQQIEFADNFNLCESSSHEREIQTNIPMFNAYKSPSSEQLVIEATDVFYLDQNSVDINRAYNLNASSNLPMSTRNDNKPTHNNNNNNNNNKHEIMPDTFNLYTVSNKQNAGKIHLVPKFNHTYNSAASIMVNDNCAYKMTPSHSPDQNLFPKFDPTHDSTTSVTIDDYPRHQIAPDTFNSYATSHEKNVATIRSCDQNLVPEYKSMYHPVTSVRTDNCRHEMVSDTFNTHATLHGKNVATMRPCDQNLGPEYKSMHDQTTSVTADNCRHKMVPDTSNLYATSHGKNVATMRSCDQNLVPKYKSMHDQTSVTADNRRHEMVRDMLNPYATLHGKNVATMRSCDQNLVPEYKSMYNQTTSVMADNCRHEMVPATFNSHAISNEPRVSNSAHVCDQNSLSTFNLMYDSATNQMMNINTECEIAPNIFNSYAASGRQGSTDLAYSCNQNLTTKDNSVYDSRTNETNLSKYIYNSHGTERRVSIEHTQFENQHLNQSVYHPSDRTSNLSTSINNDRIFEVQDPIQYTQFQDQNIVPEFDRIDYNSAVRSSNSSEPVHNNCIHNAQDSTGYTQFENQNMVPELYCIECNPTARSSHSSKPVHDRCIYEVQVPTGYTQIQEQNLISECNHNRYGSMARSDLSPKSVHNSHNNEVQNSVEEHANYQDQHAVAESDYQVCNEIVNPNNYPNNNVNPCIYNPYKISNERELTGSYDQSVVSKFEPNVYNESPIKYITMRSLNGPDSPIDEIEQIDPNTFIAIANDRNLLDPTQFRNQNLRIKNYNACTELAIDTKGIWKGSNEKNIVDEKTERQNMYENEFYAVNSYELPATTKTSLNPTVKSFKPYKPTKKRSNFKGRYNFDDNEVECLTINVKDDAMFNLEKLRAGLPSKKSDKTAAPNAEKSSNTDNLPSISPEPQLNGILKKTAISSAKCEESEIEFSDPKLVKAPESKSAPENLERKKVSFSPHEADVTIID